MRIIGGPPEYWHKFAVVLRVENDQDYYEGEWMRHACIVVRIVDASVQVHKSLKWTSQNEISLCYEEIDVLVVGNSTFAENYTQSLAYGARQRFLREERKEEEKVCLLHGLEMERHLYLERVVFGFGIQCRNMIRSLFCFLFFFTVIFTFLGHNRHKCNTTLRNNE